MHYRCASAASLRVPWTTIRGTCRLGYRPLGWLELHDLQKPNLWMISASLVKVTIRRRCAGFLHEERCSTPMWPTLLTSKDSFMSLPTQPGLPTSQAQNRSLSHCRRPAIGSRGSPPEKSDLRSRSRSLRRSRSALPIAASPAGSIPSTSGNRS